MQKNDVFDIQYSRLNKGQREAVDAIEGPVMVVAGPGTGKTSILTLRIANILKRTDTAARNILALTFTESGVYSMRRKLAEIIDGEAYKVNIYTFHGFCNDVIKNYPEEFPRIISSTAASDIDQIRIIEQAIDTIKLERLRPYGDPYYYVRPVLSKIKELKRENVRIEDVRKLNESAKALYVEIPDLYYESGAHKGKMKGKYKNIEKNLEKNQELLLIYEYYEEELRRQKLFDFEDMILEVVAALRTNEDLLLQLQEEYQYILADEHQDANASQNALLELLSSFHENPNLFIVGDEKQAIYRFQGASLDNFLYFKNLYPGAKVIALEDNYRSTQNILDASHSLILNNKAADENLRVRLKSNYEKSKKTVEKIKRKDIFLYEFETAEEELSYLAQSLKDKIAEGVAPGEIAVLYRDNRDAVPIAAALRKTDVPFAILSDQDVLSNDDIQKVLLLLRAVSDISNTQTLSQALFVDFLDLNPLDVYKLIRAASDRHEPIYEIMRQIISDGNGLSVELKIEQPETVAKVYNQFLRWSTLSHNRNLVEFFEMLVDEAGIVKAMLASPSGMSRLNVLNSFFVEIRKVLENHKEYKLADFLAYIDTLKNYKIRMNRAPGDSERDSVSLMTAHKSKGLEFAVVYIVGATDGHWGNRRNRNFFNLGKTETDESEDEADDSHEIEDERRLFYVALTRAKHEANISFFKTGAEGKPESPSQFIAELDQEQVEYADTSRFSESFKRHGETLLLPGKDNSARITDAAYLRELFLHQGLSVTALNNYLKCPWEYFFKNLIRVPSPQEKQQLYGTAVHDTLKEFFNKYRIEQDLSRDELILIFEGNLRRKPLSLSDFEETLEKGRRALGSYYDFYNPTWPRNVHNEFNISCVFVELNDLELEEKILHEAGQPLRVLVRGILDKIEIKDDGHVRVVDYKTAKPMSRNAIEGKTKDANGDYKRQLVFYRLLLDRYDDHRYAMDCGMIDFVEPDENGRFKREEFEISEDEVTALETEIKRVSKEILMLAFWNSRCDDRDCEFCHLRNIMHIEGSKTLS
jgi:DNA helicase-2/ATP-dependent DNA helicase PcrA